MSSTDGSASLTRENRDRAAVLLLSLWGELDAVRQFASGDERMPGLRPTPDWLLNLPADVGGETPRMAIRRWRDVFDSELQLVRAARNSVAHSIDIADSDLVAAVRAAAKLLIYAHLSTRSPGSEEDVIISDSRIAEALRFGN